jgi:hypothetical protein
VGLRVGELIENRGAQTTSVQPVRNWIKLSGLEHDLSALAQPVGLAMFDFLRFRGPQEHYLLVAVLTEPRKPKRKSNSNTNGEAGRVEERVRSF